MRGGKLDPWWQWQRTAAGELLLLEGELGQRSPTPHFENYAFPHIPNTIFNS